MPTAYVTVAALVENFRGDEIVQLISTDAHRYLGRAPSVADLGLVFPTARAGDVGLAEAEDALYGHDGTAFVPLEDRRLRQRMDWAGRLIDSYLSPRYTLPLEAALVEASPLAEIAADLVRYGLYDDKVPEAVEDRYRHAVGWLKEVQAGRASLGQRGTAVATGEGRVAVAPGRSNIDWAAYG